MSEAVRVRLCASASPIVGSVSRIAVRNAEGLFLSGDWVGTVGMLADAAAASGRAAGEAAALFARHQAPNSIAC